MTKQAKAEKGHLAANGALTLTQRTVTSKALYDAKRKSRAHKAMRDAPLMHRCLFWDGGNK